MPSGKSEEFQALIKGQNPAIGILKGGNDVK